MRHPHLRREPRRTPTVGVRVPARRAFQSLPPERPRVVELRALGSTGSSPEGALADGPEPGELADFGSAVIPGRRTSCRKVLFVADGGSQCPEGPCCAAGSAASCGEAGCSSARRSRPRLSLGFPRVPSCSLEASVAISGRWDTARGCGIPASGECWIRSRRTERLIHSKAVDLRWSIQEVLAVLRMYSAELP
jgi:hypothetical protein